MTDYRLGFTEQENSVAYQLYRRLTQMGVQPVNIDKGYAQANFGGAHCPQFDDLSCLKGVGDHVISAEEVLDVALAMAQQGDRYRRLVEGVVRHPLPWMLDDLDPTTTFDATVRRRVQEAIRILDTLLRRQQLRPGNPVYIKSEWRWGSIISWQCPTKGKLPNWGPNFTAASKS